MSEQIRTGTCIDGIWIPLPHEAKFVAQENNGVWFWFARKPRVVYDDEGPKEPIAWGFKNKRPIQYKNDKGYDASLVTAVAPDNWLDTLTRTIRSEDMPSEIFFGV